GPKIFPHRLPRGGQAAVDKERDGVATTGPDRVVFGQGLQHGALRCAWCHRSVARRTFSTQFPFGGATRVAAGARASSGAGLDRPPPTSGSRLWRRAPACHTAGTGTTPVSR